ncbi:hypothetical protein J27TS7_01960 [Paenibacillus dendritiformis]|nr:hypothetical protein J27TS7_01960 [Paenibacillus dendritiformis]
MGRKLRVECLTEWDIGQKGTQGCPWLCLTQWENGAMGSRLGEGVPDGMGCWSKGHARGAPGSA